MQEQEHSDITSGVQGFRKVGATPLSAKETLRPLIAAEIAGRPFNELFGVTLSHESANVVGLALLSELTAQGYSLNDFDAVGALTAAAVPLATAMVDSAAQMGYALDGFVMDFVYPSIKGPSIEGKRVVLVDSWLSEKSYVQTSSLVTLRNGNELSLDFGIVTRAGAEVVAIASLIGGIGNGGGARAETADEAEGTGMKSVEVIDPVDGVHQSIPFIPVFDERELRGTATERNDADAADAQKLGECEDSGSSEVRSRA